MVQVFGSLAGGVGQIISVAKYMVKRRGPPSQRWRSFLRSHAADIAAMDLFVVPAGAPRSGSTSQQIQPRNGLHTRSQRHSLGMMLPAT
jgi:hypothetical protein